MRLREISSGRKWTLLLRVRLFNHCTTAFYMSSIYVADVADVRLTGELKNPLEVTT